MKKWMTWLLALAMLLSLGAVTAAAEESEEPVPREPGWCGEDIRYSFEDGVLTLEGSGRMDDFYAGQPWQAHQNEIREVRLLGSISYIGAYAFPDYDRLEKVTFGDSLVEVGQGAFSGCDSLDGLQMPGTFKIFGEESFSHCKNLKRIEFRGGFPKFKLNCLWDTYTKLIYPAERPWPVELVQQLEEAFQGRIEFLSSDGTDPYVPEGETEAPAPEETLPPETEAPAVPSTEATEAPTEAVTEAPETLPETRPSEPSETEPAVTEEEYVEFTEPQEPPRQETSPSKGKLPLLIGLMVVSGGAALFLLGRMSGNRKKEFDGNFSEILLEDERKRPAGKKSGTARKTGPKTGRKKGGKYQK